jgi:hypothetical protein
MRHRLPTAALASALALSLALGACASDGDDTTEQSDSTSSAIVDDTTPATDAPDSTEAPAPAGVELTLADEVPADADIVIEAAGTTDDRPIRRGGQSQISQGQTFAVDADTTLTEVSFHVSAPEGVAAGQSVEFALYQVGNTVTMVPSGPVDLGDGTDGTTVVLPAAIEAGASTHLVFALPGAALSPGQYAVVLSFGDGSGPAEMFLQHPDGDAYADGVAITLDGEFWKSDTNDHDAAVTFGFDA